MRASRLRECRALVAKYPNNISTKMIVELCDEVERLRKKGGGLNGDAPFTDSTSCPFGKEHKGTPLGEVPEDFLHWWFRQNSDRGLIQLEIDHGEWAKRAVAKKKLRLHDYLKAKFALEKR